MLRILYYVLCDGVAEKTHLAERAEYGNRRASRALSQKTKNGNCPAYVRSTEPKGKQVMQLVLPLGTHAVRQYVFPFDLGTSRVQVAPVCRYVGAVLLGIASVTVWQLGCLVYFVAVFGLDRIFVAGVTLRSRALRSRARVVFFCLFVASVSFQCTHHAIEWEGAGACFEQIGPEERRLVTAGQKESSKVLKNYNTVATRKGSFLIK